MLVWAGGCSRSRSRAAPYRRCKKATLPLAFVVRRAAEVGALRGGAASAVPEARSSQACTRRLLLGRHWGGPRRLVLVIFLVCSCAAAAPCSSCPLGNQYIVYSDNDDDGWRRNFVFGFRSGATRSLINLCNAMQQ
jgi:hypothetical protein